MTDIPELTRSNWLEQFLHACESVLWLGRSNPVMTWPR